MLKLHAPIQTLTFVLSAAIVLAGCQDKQDAAGAAPPAPEVVVLKVNYQPTIQYIELSGRTSAYQSSQVRPQVSGIITQRLFAEGSLVKQGQALYQLDAAPLLAVVDSAKAVVARNEANVKALAVKVERYRALVEIHAVSQQDFDDIQAQLALAHADEAASRAALQTAQINANYSTIRAPITGRTGPSMVTPGALVTANQPSPLVVINQLDPIYVDISQSSAELLTLRQKLASGDLRVKGAAHIRITLENGDVYPQEGKLQFASDSVDEASGTVLIRAVFPNPKNILLPGMFVKAKINQGINNKAVLIPQKAVARNHKGDAIVLVVDAKGMVSERVVATERSEGDSWVIGSGLQIGEQVIIEGGMMIKAGMSVKATEQMAAQQAAKPKTTTPKTTAP